MKILSIETSCDETGVSVLQGDKNSITILGNTLASQIEIHAKYGGVFPAMAKRAHKEKIVPLFREALTRAQLLQEGIIEIAEELKNEIVALCNHEEGLAEQIISLVEKHIIPDIDAIAVTAGPGLEPALWVGINTAIAFGKLWNKPVYPINHMEGHVISAVFEQQSDTQFLLHEFQYPALALLVSGGHTELVLIEEPLSYKKIGVTKDDAAGEAFDKVARVLGLPYPGGPKISSLAKEAREENLVPEFTLPRPMIHSGDYNFSYSGLKTAVLYLVRDLQKNDPYILENQTMIKMIAREFEEAAIEVLVKKVQDAVSEFHIQTLIVGGGVAANMYLREQINEKIKDRFGINVLFPIRELSTDNSIMIGMALYYQLLHKNKKPADTIRANGNLSLQ